MLVQTDKIAKLIESRMTSLKKNASNDTMPTHDDSQSISQPNSTRFVDRKSNTAVPGKRNQLNAILSADKESVWSKLA